MKKYNYTVEQMAETRWFLSFDKPNSKGETLVIEISRYIDDPNWKNSNPKLWKKNGYIDRVLEDYWSIDTYITDTENGCYMCYNPQHKLNEDGKRMVLNFDWMLEATEENKEKLINEVISQFYNAKGKTATEIKIEKVKEHAERNNITLYEEIPEGWEIDKTAITAPCGSDWISNMESFKSGKRKSGLLLV